MSRQIRLEDLAMLAPVLTQAAADFHRENCMVCLDHKSHANGVHLDVEFVNTREQVQVTWAGAVTAEMLDCYADQNKRVDFGACAIALLLLPVFTDYLAIRSSATGNGIDYFLVSNSGDDNLIFNNSAVLEVSGIQDEDASNSVNSRIQDKRRRLNRMAKSSTSITPNLDTYICVVGFGQPRAKVVLV